MKRSTYINVPLSGGVSKKKKHKVKKSAFEVDVNVSEKVLNSHMKELKKSYDGNFYLFMEYINSKNVFSSRFIEFYALKKSKTGELLMVCRPVNTGGKIRSFRLRKVISLTCTELVFKPQWDKSWL